MATVKIKRGEDLVELSDDESDAEDLATVAARTLNELESGPETPLLFGFRVDE